MTMYAALFLTAVAQAGAAPVPAVPPVEVARQGAALRVVRMLYSEEVMRVQVERMMSETLPKAFAANLEVAEVEVSYPGFSARLLEMAEAEMVPMVMKRLPQFHDRLTPIYARNFTEADLARMAGFYASAPGRSMILAVARGADYRALTDKALSSGGEAPITQADAAAITAPAIDAALAEASVADLDAFIQMSEAIGMEKIERNDAEVDAAKLEWANTPDPRMEALFEARAVEIIQAYEAEAE